MIKIDSGKISFVENHLFDPVIEKFDGILERYREYEIELFIHIVSDPSCRYESGVGSNRTLKDISALSAKERFKSILKNRAINANPKGFYANKLKDDQVYPDEIKSVSLAYCHQNEVQKHFSARKSEYGFVFFHDFLQSLGMLPVRYINEEDDESIRRLVFNEAFLLEAYGKNYDMRWEKEWRINRDLLFELDDVAFIIVPDEEYAEFIDFTIAEGLDYYILPASVFTDPLKFFLMADGMEHHSWSQIALYGEWKVDFDMFPEFTSDEETEFIARCGEHLNCLAKAEIQDAYERRYVSRFMNFASSLTESFLGKTSFNSLKTVSANAREPYQTHRDLMIHCYTKRLEVQRERIDL
jgi:hypothetical protein